jgi:hypothetical protein
MAAHRVDVVRDIEGDHGLAAHAVRMAVDDLHHRLHPRFERGVRRIANQLVVFDKVDIRRA